jgi:LysM repeat protein
VTLSIWQKVVVVLLGSGILGGTIYFWRTISQPRSLRHFESIPWVTYVHPNVEKLKQAQILNRDGKMREARDVVIKALTTAPRSPVTRELRDLLGEINTSIFFSDEPSPRKIEYTVKRGEALSLIARKLTSSAEAIMRVNKLASTLIHPSEKLFVPQLDFTITIDLSRNRVAVHDSHGFFTQYPIAYVDLLDSQRGTLQTRVKAKSFWTDGRRVTRNRATSDQAIPRIYLSHIGYVLYGVVERGETAGSEMEVEEEESGREPNVPEGGRLPQGIAMWKGDIAELELLIRKGTPVTVILDRPSS